MTTRRNVEDISLIIDGSKKNQRFFIQAANDVEGQSQKWERATRLFPELSRTRFHLVSSGTQAQYQGSANSFSELLNGIADIKLENTDSTQIGRSIQSMDAELERHGISSDLTLVVAKTVNPNQDKMAALEKVGADSPAPIAIIVPSLKDNIGDDNRTSANDHETLRALSESSGVIGETIDFNGRLNTLDFNDKCDTDFVDYVIVTAAARAGVIDQLKRSNVVNPAIWNQFSDNTLRTINEPEKEEPEKKMALLPWFLAAAIPVAFLAGFGVCQWLDEDTVCPEPAAPLIVEVPRVNTPVEDLTSGITVRFNDTSIGFGQDSAIIPFEFYDELNEIGQYLQDNPSQFSKLIIEGHTSLEGDESYNQGLSERRATAIVDYLEANFTIRDGLLEARGFGEERPLHNPELAESDKQNNRRVVFAPQF